jgi:hypothetical protein
MNPDDESPGGVAYDAILKDLETGQGAWRRRPMMLRLLMLGLPTVLVVGMAFVGLSALRGMSTSVVLAALAGALALLGVMAAPQRPALGERLAQVATVIALAAFGVELTAIRAGDGDVGSGCLSITTVVALLSSAVTMALLASTGLPLRVWHRVGLAVAGVAGACTAVWHHCPSDRLLHVLVSHALGPLACLALIVVAAGRWRRRFAP